MANANTNIHRKRLPMKMPGTVCKALIEKACKASHRFVISFITQQSLTNSPTSPEAGGGESIQMSNPAW